MSNISFREALGLEVRTNYPLHSRDGSSVLPYSYVLCPDTMPPIEVISVGSNNVRMYLSGVLDSIRLEVY